MTEEEHWQEVWRKANDKIDAAYWRFCRCVRAAPPILVCPDAYRRLKEAERYLHAIRTNIPGTDMDKIKKGDALYCQSSIGQGVISYEVLKVGRRYVTLSGINGQFRVDLQTMRDEQGRLFVRKPGEFEARQKHFERYCQLQERLKEFTRGLAAVHITSEQIDELNATLDRMPKRE